MQISTLIFQLFRRLMSICSILIQICLLRSIETSDIPMTSKSQHCNSRCSARAINSLLYVHDDKGQDVEILQTLLDLFIIITEGVDIVLENDAFA